MTNNNNHKNNKNNNSYENKIEFFYKKYKY